MLNARDASMPAKFARCDEEVGHGGTKITEELVGIPQLRAGVSPW